MTVSVHSTALAALPRYAVAVVVGLAVDLGIALMLVRLLGLPVLIGAVGGFLVGVAVNYLFFELWVFRTRRLTGRRLLQAYVAAQGALAVRLGAAWILGVTLPVWPYRAELILVAAAGSSFAVNFVLVRFFLVKEPHRLEPEGRGT